MNGRSEELVAVTAIDPFLAELKRAQEAGQRVLAAAAERPSAAASARAGRRGGALWPGFRGTGSAASVRHVEQRSE